jgi:hypothetical protein
VQHLFVDQNEMCSKTTDISANSTEYQNHNKEIKYNTKTEQQKFATSITCHQSGNHKQD